MPRAKQVMVQVIPGVYSGDRNWGKIAARLGSAISEIWERNRYSMS